MPEAPVADPPVAATAATAAASPETPPAAPDPVAALEARFAALETATVNLKRENGTLKSQVARMPNADAFIEAFGGYEQVKADLLAKGVPQDVIDDLAEKPKALKAMHATLVGAQATAPADPAKELAAVREELAALKATKAAGGNGTGFTTTAARGGGAPAAIADDDIDVAFLEGRLSADEYRKRLKR